MLRNYIYVKKHASGGAILYRMIEINYKKSQGKFFPDF